MLLVGNAAELGVVVADLLPVGLLGRPVGTDVLERLPVAHTVGLSVVWVDDVAAYVAPEAVAAEGPPRNMGRDGEETVGSSGHCEALSNDNVKDLPVVVAVSGSPVSATSDGCVEPPGYRADYGALLLVVDPPGYGGVYEGAIWLAHTVKFINDYDQAKRILNKVNEKSQDTSAVKAVKVVNGPFGRDVARLHLVFVCLHSFSVEVDTVSVGVEDDLEVLADPP